MRRLPALFLRKITPQSWSSARHFPVQHPEHRIPGKSQQRDLNRGEAMQAVFGFRFEEHREGITAPLLSGEDFISIQILAELADGQNNLPWRPVWPAPPTARLNAQLFHPTQLASVELAGSKSMPVEHTDQRFKRARHGVTGRQRHSAADNQ